MKPREWLIERGSWIAYEPGTDGVVESECIHVVEKLAYDQLMSALLEIVATDAEYPTSEPGVSRLKHCVAVACKALDGR